MNIEKLQKAEQKLQTIAARRQSVQAQLAECESARKEISDESYKIIGNIMVKKSKESLEAELSEKEAKLKEHLETFTREEQGLQKEVQQLQQEMMQSDQS